MTTTALDPALAHRRTQATVTLTAPDGSPCVDTEVEVAQARHAVAFACIGFDFVGLANAEEPGPVSVFGGADAASAAGLVDLWLGLFDTATLPFYWAGFEAERGRPDTNRMRRTAQWFRDRGVTVKGHPLVWHTLAPDWLRALPTDEVEQVVRARVRREVSGLAGLVDTWDVVNEAVIMPVFANEPQRNGVTRLCWDRGRIATVRTAFEEARAANPAATLLLNDFDLSTAYECLVEGLLEAGVQIDALGLQTHMHQGYWGEAATREVLDRFARFGLPLHLTETTLVSGDLMPPEIEDLNDHQVPSWPSTPEGEARQADEVVRHYRTLMAHPSVASVTYWGLTDQGAWLGAPAGLVRADGTPKPAYDALRRLVREDWWLAPTRLRTDAAGRVRFEGWAGDYALTGPGGTAQVTLPAGPASASVTLGA